MRSICILQFQFSGRHCTANVPARPAPRALGTARIAMQVPTRAARGQYVGRAAYRLIGPWGIAARIGGAGDHFPAFSVTCCSHALGGPAMARSRSLLARPYRIHTYVYRVRFALPLLVLFIPYVIGRHTPGHRPATRTTFLVITYQSSPPDGLSIHAPCMRQEREIRCSRLITVKSMNMQISFTSHAPDRARATFTLPFPFYRLYLSLFVLLAQQQQASMR